MVVRDVGVEIALAHVDHHLAQQPDAGELVQGVVDRGQRHRDAGGARLVEQFLGGHMARAALEQQLGQCQALSRRPQAGRLQLLQDTGIGSRRQHLVILFDSP